MLEILSTSQGRGLDCFHIPTEKIRADAGGLLWKWKLDTLVQYAKVTMSPSTPLSHWDCSWVLPFMD